MLKSAEEKGDIKKDSDEIHVVVFKLSDEEFAVDINQVREIIRVSPIVRIPNTPEFIEGIINLRGNIITVIDLGKKLFGKAIEITKDTRIMIVEIDDVTLGLMVDSVIEVMRIPKNNIEKTPDIIAHKIHSDYIKGIARIDDRLIIIIDIRNVILKEEVGEIKKIGASNKNAKDSSGR